MQSGNKCNGLVRFHYGENNINTGPLKEIPEICIDHFYGDDLNSSVFFLSHAHTDHLVGLETDTFLRRLKQPGVKLYCHPLTPILLGSFQRYLGGPDGIKKLVGLKKIVPLDVGQTKLLRIPRLSTTCLEVKVTLLSAGHCPGSVMFLFETSNVRILHTGDFRLTPDDLKRMPHLHDTNKKPKPLDHLYVDTTFCSKSANLFPNRKDVLDEAIESIRGWISLSKNHIIHISFSAKFAHEYVLQELYKKFQQKIHVRPDRREIYRHIPELYACVTLNNDTQLHLCGDRSCVDGAQAITLRLSSIWYTKASHTSRQNISWSGKFLMLCYSMHSSLNEIAQTIEYLKPSIVTPLVLPVRSEVSEIRDALQSVCTATFQFEDYRSSRDDFDGQQPPSKPCREEQDETDMGVADMEVELVEETDHCENVSNKNTSNPTSPAKRQRLDEASKSVWQYEFSPSPQSKNSQSSSDGSQSSSQEINTQSSDFNSFTLPKNVIINPARRNLPLEATKFIPVTLEYTASPLDSSNIEDSSSCNDDEDMNSQRL